MTEARRAGIDEVFRSPEDRSFRRLPRIAGGALRLAWSAAPRELTGSFVLQVLTGAGVALQLLLGRRVLDTILQADRLDLGMGDVVPALVAFLAVSAALSFAYAAQSELTRLLGEVVGRHAQDRIIDVATVVDLEAYESPDFHDRLMRAQMAANFRPMNLTNNLLRMSSALIGILGLLAALAALQPLLVPFVLLAYLPIWVATIKNSRTTHHFGWHMTPSDRKRQYLSMALTGKAFAQELRAFDLAAPLRTRYDALFDERIARVRDVTRIRVRRSLQASVASSVLSGAGVVMLVALLLADRMSVASAAAAAVALQQLGGRLSGIAHSGSALYEDALFLEDFNSFLQLAPAVAAARPQEPAPGGFSTLTIDHVNFAYPGTERLALDDVSLEIHAGATPSSGSSPTTTSVEVPGVRGRPRRFTVMASSSRGRRATRSSRTPSTTTGRSPGSASSPVTPTTRPSRRRWPTTTSSRPTGSPTTWPAAGARRARSATTTAFGSSPAPAAGA